MKVVIIKVMILLACVVACIKSECNVCQSSNNIACHTENHYSLCINGIPTEDFIQCPKHYVCTSDPNVCYPLATSKITCVQDRHLCGVCNKNKVYACINETTIAFCYGEDKPMEGAEVSYCFGDTVCDIYSTDGFCTESHRAKPSCIKNDDVDEPDEIITTAEPTTAEYSNTATEPPTTIRESTTAEPATTIRESTTAEPATTTIEPATTAAALTTLEFATTTIKPTIAEPTTITLMPTTTETESATTTIETVITTLEPTTAQPTTTTTESASTTAETPTTTIKPTSPAVPRDPDTICKDAATTGSFYADDSTCTTFIVCYLAGDSLAGIKKSCKAGQYFPPGAKFCSTTKPDKCI